MDWKWPVGGRAIWICNCIFGRCLYEIFEWSFGKLISIYLIVVWRAKLPSSYVKNVGQTDQVNGSSPIDVRVLKYPCHLVHTDAIDGQG